jgi:hypothetical protein
MSKTKPTYITNATISGIPAETVGKVFANLVIFEYGNKKLTISLKHIDREPKITIKNGNR